MKTVILDGGTVVGSDLSFDCLKQFGEVVIYDRTTREQTIERIADADVVLTNKVVIDGPVLDACPSVKLVSVFATGYNVIDTAAAAERGVTVCNVPAYSTASVAQMTFALILELTMHVGAHSDSVHRGEWSSCPDFCFWLTPLVELSGKTLGIIGYGNIGRAVEKIAKSFGMRVLVCNRTPFEGSVSLDELLKESDIISLHCPLTSANKELINEATLAKVKKGAYLVNTARGGLINEAALAGALNSGYIAGAALDVVSAEPITDQNPLLTAKNCILTPHIAWAPRESRERLLDVTVKNIAAFLDGKTQNKVN